MIFHCIDTPWFISFLFMNIQFGAVINSIAVNIFVSTFYFACMLISQSKIASMGYINVQ